MNPISHLPNSDQPDQLPARFKAMRSTKTFGHDLGFSCAFRQWRAESHCRLIHGYALGFKFVFSAEVLDHCGWVVDFGGLKDLKQLLADTFDHKLLVAADDPHLQTFLQSNTVLWDVIIVPATGCEAFAHMVYAVTEQWLKDAGFSPRCSLVSVEVMEHGANSAICFG